MANVPGRDEAADQVMGAHHPAPALDHVHLQRRLLDAGLVLLTSGCLVLTHTIGNRDANAEHALFGFALLLLGVFLITLMMLSPVVAHRFPAAARFGTAVADAVHFYFLQLALAPAGN